MHILISIVWQQGVRLFKYHFRQSALVTVCDINHDEFVRFFLLILGQKGKSNLYAYYVKSVNLHI